MSRAVSNFNLQWSLVTGKISYFDCKKWSLVALDRWSLTSDIFQLQIVRARKTGHI